MPASSRPRTTATTSPGSTPWPPSSSPAWTPRSTSASTPSAPTKPRPSRARPAWPTPAWPTRSTRSCSPPNAGRSWPRPAPSRSARCGPPPVSRTRPTRTPCTSPNSSPPASSTPCRRRPSTPPSTTASITGDTVTRGYDDANATLNALDALGISYNDVVAAARVRRPGQVRGQLEGTAGRRRGRPRRCTEGRLAHMTHAQLRRHGRCPPGPRTAPARTAGGPGRHPDLRARTPPCGVPTPKPRPPSGSAGSRPPPSRSRWSADILALRDALRAEGVTRIVLCGMGGSSLAPEVIAGTAGVELTVLDSTDPEQVAAALADRLAETAIVVSSKSGSTAGDRLAAPDLRARLHRGRHRREEPDHHRHRSRARRWTRPPARPATAPSSTPTRTSAAATRR